jgi:hypothetical protein
MVYTRDGIRPGSRKARDGLAQKTLIATFPGSGFTAEREGDALNVYLISDDNVTTGATLSNVGDRARGPMTAARMQARIVERRKTSA